MKLIISDLMRLISIFSIALAISSTVLSPALAQKPIANKKEEKNILTTPVHELTADQLDALQQHPITLLAMFPAGGPKMASYISQLVLLAPEEFVNSLLSVADIASPEQGSAIGAGIVRAVRILKKEELKLTQEISQKMMKYGSLHMKITYFAIGPFPSIDLAMLDIVELSTPKFYSTFDVSLGKDALLEASDSDFLIYLQKQHNAASQMNVFSALNIEAFQRRFVTSFFVVATASANEAHSTSPTK